MITVQDNGIGRKASQNRKNNSQEGHVSSGISTTQERLALLNFEKEQKTNTIDIVDLVDENNISLGTKTVIRLTIN